MMVNDTVRDGAHTEREEVQYWGQRVGGCRDGGRGWKMRHVDWVFPTMGREIGTENTELVQKIQSLEYVEGHTERRR